MRYDGISVVVPVYNSRESLKPLVARLKSTLENCADNFERYMGDARVQRNEAMAQLAEAMNWMASEEPALTAKHRK